MSYQKTPAAAGKGMVGAIGSQQVWAQTLNDMCRASPLCALALAVSFGAYIRPAARVALSHVFVLHGLPATGKTTILNGCASIHAGAESFNGFGIAIDQIEAILKMRGAGFLPIDEMDHLLQTANPAMVLTYLTNGGGGEIGRDGLLTRPAWDTTFMASTNEPLSSFVIDFADSSLSQGRLFEFDMEDGVLHTFDAGHATVRGYAQSLHAHNGFGSTEIDRLLGTPAGEAWIGEYHAQFDEMMREDSSAPLRDQQHQAQFFALAFAGSRIMKDLLGSAAGASAHSAVRIAAKRAALIAAEEGV